MARRGPPKRFRFTKADAKACERHKGDRKGFGRCMAAQVKKRNKG